MARYAADPTEVEAFILDAAATGESGVPRLIQESFNVSRATAYNYLSEVVEAGAIARVAPGKYELKHEKRQFMYQVPGLMEHEVWENDLKPLLEDLPKNTLDIWHYGCTEMINNVVDHSESAGMMILADCTALKTEIEIHDQGVGIFRKIADALDLEDDRHAVLELSKGKVTTDPDNHTGEGIFFSSRAFDSYRILSGDVFFAHSRDDEHDWILGYEKSAGKVHGTTVSMALANKTDREIKDVFDKYVTDTEEYRFDKTAVPVKLLEYGDEKLVSRSQAKRLLSRFDRFRVVVLDFHRIESIGQAFADEVFRVFVARHPEVEIVPIKTNEQVARMINRVTRPRGPQQDLFPEPPEEPPAG